MAFAKRTHSCGELRKEHIGQTVVLNGWCHRIRDLGGLFFVDLRDRTGVTQVYFDVEKFDNLRNLKSEYVLSIEGEVVERLPEAVNPKLPTGEVEVVAQSFEILNTCDVLPFQLSDEDQMERVSEELRIKYRYLDLRRASMYNKLAIRAACVRLIRKFLDEREFIEVETPLFTKSTPEGARDYLVPYRLCPGQFYALPQSPQQYKQLLMVAGIERYYQIAKCFRDEAQRADRQPEFTQLDLEMSFVTQEDVLQLTEELTRFVCNSVIETFGLPKDPVSAFPRLTYDESMQRYGTDKPDLRFGLELFDVTECVLETDFQVFANAVRSGSVVRGVCYPGGTNLSRKDISVFEDLVKSLGAKGLAQLPIPEGQGVAVGGIGKFLRQDELQRIFDVSKGQPGDLLLLVADSEEVVCAALSRLRLEIGERLGLRDPRKLSFCWVLDFPLVFWDEETQRWEPSHHPFTMPKHEDWSLLESSPGRVRADCYDIVCNGIEWASGSIRIHRADIQSQVFNLLGVDEATQKRRFGHILEAFKMGAPPHGGIAPGIDRLVMLLLGEENIREVMAFPKIGGGYDPLMDAPSEIDPEQWEELGLELRRTEI